MIKDFHINRMPLIFIFLSILCADIPPSQYDNSCIADKDNREIYRNQFTYHETIQSENFVIHYTTSDVDSQFVNGQWFNLQSNHGYAQSIINHVENALSIYLEQGWEDIPPDCDEEITDINSPHHCINYGGNSLYDIYISNDAAGMVVPENPYPVSPYTGGYTSYMKISTLLNGYESLPSWSHHVVAHELHHSIQMRYGYSVSGSPGNYMYNGWLFEQTATYMENVIYPNSIHLRTMLSNCNVVTPLTYPHYSIDYPAEIYPYRSALWQKFLVESLGDSSIIRYIWEGYGLDYATENPVSLFPIYNNAIELVTDNQNSLSDSYSNYAIWRYFTGNRSIPNQYFNEAGAYCTSSSFSNYEESFTLPSNKGGAHFINLPSEDINLAVSTDSIASISLIHLIIYDDSSIDLINLSPQDNSFYLSLYPEATNTLIVNSKYNHNDSDDINYTISIHESNLLGDANLDDSVDVLDVVCLVNLILTDGFNTYSDLNDDGQVDITDVVQLISIILN